MLRLSQDKQKNCAGAYSFFDSNLSRFNLHSNEIFIARNDARHKKTKKFLFENGERYQFFIAMA